MQIFSGTGCRFYLGRGRPKCAIARENALLQLTPFEIVAECRAFEYQYRVQDERNSNGREVEVMSEILLPGLDLNTDLLTKRVKRIKDLSPDDYVHMVADVQASTFLRWRKFLGPVLVCQT